MTGEQFDVWKAPLGLVLGPLLAFAVWFADVAAPSELPALTVLALVWWLTEALPAAVVALAIALFAVVFGLATPKQAFAAFGSPILFLFVGSFFIAEAMRLHGLGERLARALLRYAHGPRSLLTMLGVAACVLSMVMSNAAATAMLLPIALSASQQASRRFQAAAVLMIAWAASVGGLATPVGTPPNLLGVAALRKEGVELSFFDWMQVGVPIALVMMAVLALLLSFLFRISSSDKITIDNSRSAAWSLAEWGVLGSVGLAMIGWIAPSVFAELAPGTPVTRWVSAHMTEEVVALAAALPLFVLPAARASGAARPVLTWAEASRIEWGVIMFFAGGILLGDLANSSGLADRLSRSLVAVANVSNTWTITAFVTAVAIVLSEATSNTATATLMAPLAAKMAVAAGAAPIPAVLGATLGASFGFMMPISTAPNALAYATGKVRVGQMMRSGVVFDVLGYVLLLAMLRVLCPLLGWA